MPGNVLVICDTDIVRGLDEYSLEKAGYTPIEVSLYQHRANPPQYPYWRDVVAQYKKDGTPIEGVILYDDSVTDNAPHLKHFHNELLEVDEAIQQLNAQTQSGMEVGVESGDVVEDSIAANRMQNEIEQIFEKHKKKRLAALEEHKETLEYFLTQTPPSQEGLNCMKELKAASSPFQKAPIIVCFAFPDKKPEFLGAGAAAVRTTFDFDSLSHTDLLLEAIAKQNKWAGEKKSFTGHAQNPPGGTWTSEKDL